MAMQRRTLFSAAGAMAALAATGARAAETPKTAAAAPSAPDAAHPILACFNENPLGLSAGAKKALIASAERCNRYPFADAEKLRKACAAFIGGKPEAITLSQGSAEAIRASIEAYKTEGVALVIPELTYGDGEMCAQRNGIPVIRVPMGPNWSVDPDGMRSAVKKHKGPSIVYFANPNNPTSTIADSAKLEAWIREDKKTIFLVDEAYAEFVADPAFRSMAPLVADGLENVIVLKTFSKIFAMAGLRLGFAYAAPKTAARVRDHIAYDIFQNVPAIACALEELNDEAFLRESCRINDASKKIITGACDKLGLKYLPSQTNFIFVELPKKTTLEAFAKAMKDRHVLVGRPFPPATGWCRISMVSEADSAYIADAMATVRKAGVI